MNKETIEEFLQSYSVGDKMGIGPNYKPGSSKDYLYDQIRALEDANPKPDKWEYIRHFVAGEYIVLELMYKGCTNYEGKKILVCKCKESDFMFKKPNIDPHFTDKPGTTIHPIARFEPTAHGWLDAVEYAKVKNRGNYQAMR